jgi:[CysO sulfur-carrier protein]-S-L-cysteine hydrolase
MRIPRSLFDDMIAHAREEAPNECVGLVASRDGEAVAVHRATNTEQSPYRFVIESREQLDLINQIDDAGLSIGAIYHSHTRTAPEPSQTDITFAQGWPGVVWIIVGLRSTEPEVRGWMIHNSDVSEVVLDVP